MNESPHLNQESFKENMGRQVYLLPNKWVVYSIIMGLWLIRQEEVEEGKAGGKLSVFLCVYRAWSLFGVYLELIDIFLKC